MKHPWLDRSPPKPKPVAAAWCPVYGSDRCRHEFTDEKLKAGEPYCVGMVCRAAERGERPTQDKPAMSYPPPIPSEPFPALVGAIGMRELGAARRLLSSGLDLPRQAMLRIVDRAIELTVREHFQHDDSCIWWLGAGCDCALSNDSRLWKAGT
jgi:hypothetical protein